tara:strand:+ start:711 stop:875 length:165 start_codon:yes stop_codon:yes gene_type:complete
MNWVKLRGSSIKKTDTENNNTVNKKIIYTVNKKLEKYYKKYYKKNNQYITWEIV